VGGGPVALQCDTADREVQHETGVARAGFQVKKAHIGETYSGWMDAWVER